MRDVGNDIGGLNVANAKQNKINNGGGSKKPSPQDSKCREESAMFPEYTNIRASVRNRDHKIIRCTSCRADDASG